MNQYIEQLTEIAKNDDRVGDSARHTLGCVKLYQSGELSAEAATHNLTSILNRVTLDITLDEHNKQNILNNLIILVSNNINNV